MTEVNETLAKEEIQTEGGVALAVSEELFPDSEQPATPEADPLDSLHGSSKLAETVEIKGNTVSAKDVVKYAFALSKMKVEEWNKLSNPKREALIAVALDALRKELKPVPKSTDGKPKLSIEEKQRIKDNKFAKQVAGQQWAGLAAMKDRIAYAPDPQKGKKTYGKVKLHSSKK